MADRKERVHPSVVALGDEFEIKIISNVAYPQFGETFATATLERILKEHGTGHLRIVPIHAAGGRIIRVSPPNADTYPEKKIKPMVGPLM